MQLEAPTPKTLPVKLAWKTLPLTHWNDETAAHLLRRIGYSATPGRIQKSLRKPIQETLKNAFHKTRPLEKTTPLAEFEANFIDRTRSIYREKDQSIRQTEARDLRREGDHLFRQYGIQWLKFARQEENSPQEKFVSFLQDIFVIEQRVIREPQNLFNYQQTLREGIQLNYPDLCKRVSQEPGMVRYLNLNESTKEKPNENFARELFELFTLGEGNYTEDDIKEAARAFTGYRINNRTHFNYAKKLHDNSPKTVFGKKGNWSGDDIIDLTFEEPAARTYIIKELCKFYLTDEDLPHPDYINALGDLWAAQNFNIRYLIDTFFKSRLFFHPAFRGNLVKSPYHFYLGLCQDLQLDVMPFTGRTLQSLRIMGQNFYNPPNVRGWLYGQHWINSSTISARRQLVDYLFNPVNEKQLNGNDKRSLQAARDDGQANFQVDFVRLNPLMKLDGEAIADHLSKFFITAPSRPTYQTAISKLLDGYKQKQKPYHEIRQVVIGLLQSPAYNLC